VQEVTDSTEALKQAFRRHASGVCLITLNDPAGNPVGFTATSVTSLGSSPALATFNVARGASSWTALREAKHVAISMLHQGSLELSKKMAADHTKRFVDDDWFREEQHQLPIFHKVNAVLLCKVRQYVEVESNAVFIVEIESGLFSEELPSLLYHQRGYVIPGERLS
jgi:flavin reductase (DIM6/NTAB) family NADH-FMN oxidoreductase RutF